MENKDLKQGLSKKGLIILVVLLLGALIAAFMWWRNYEQYIATDDANVASNRISIASMVMAQVVNQYVMEGDTVQAGDLLAELDSAVVASELATLVAQQKEMEAQLKLISLNSQTSQTALAAQRAKALASIELLNAKIKTVQIQLAHYKIKAPQSGVIAKAWMLSGDMVQPGQTLFTLDDHDKLWLGVYLEETKYGMVSIGQSSKYVLDAYPDLTFWGEVYYIGTNTASQFSMIPASNASGNFTKVTQRIPIKISIDRITGDAAGIKRVRLVSGMSAEVKIIK
jgi:membrane fusion protein (multidrug efflux system)